MLVTDPRSRASLQEITSHPWILKGYTGPPDNYLPSRDPINLPLEADIVQGMTGFEFGSTEAITIQLTKILESDEYQTAVKQASRETPITSPNPERKKGFGFDFYKRRSSTSSKDTLTNPSLEVLTPYTQADPTNAYNPLVSIYYLVREKRERERHRISSSQFSQPTPNIEKFSRMTIPKQPEVAHTSETSYEIEGEPKPTVARTRPRARTHGDDEVAETVKITIGGTSPSQSPRTVPPKDEQLPRKDLSVGGMFRRLSTRRHNRTDGSKGESSKPPPTPSLSLHPPEQKPVNISAPRKSLSIRRPKEASRPAVNASDPQYGDSELLTPPASADGSTSKKSSKLGRSTSVTEADWRRKYSRQRSPGDPPGTSSSDRSTTIRGNIAIEEKSFGGVGNTTVRAKSVGHARKEAIINRRVKRDETSPGIVNEESLGEEAARVTTCVGSGDGGVSTTPSVDYVKPVFLKGLFSVSTTSTKAPLEIRNDIIRVLEQLGVSYKEIKSGFACVHRPSIDLKSVVDNGAQSPEVTNIVTPSAHRRKLSFGGNANTSQGSSTKPATGRNRADTSYTNSDASNESVHDGVLGGSLILQFEIYIVKVPLLSLHGIQFKSVNKTNTWQYKSLASRILSELRL